MWAQHFIPCPYSCPWAALTPLGAPRKWYLNWKETTRVWALCRLTDLLVLPSQHLSQTLLHLYICYWRKRPFFFFFKALISVKMQGTRGRLIALLSVIHSEKKLWFSHPSLKMSYDVNIQWGWLSAWEVESYDAMGKIGTGERSGGLEGWQLKKNFRIYLRPVPKFNQWFSVIFY